MQEIERVNPGTFHRVFGIGDCVNKEKFTDEQNKVTVEGFPGIDYKKRLVL